MSAQYERTTNSFGQILLVFNPNIEALARNFLRKRKRFSDSENTVGHVHAIRNRNKTDVKNYDYTTDGVKNSRNKQISCNKVMKQPIEENTGFTRAQDLTAMDSHLRHQFSCTGHGKQANLSNIN